MTTTDELRRLLDERGVEHEDIADATLWKGRDGKAYTASEVYTRGNMKPSTKKLVIRHMETPEQAIAATLGRDEPPYDDLLRCLENDWHISVSWDGLRKFWCVELTEEGVRMRDAAPTAATDVLRAIDQLRRDLSCYHGQLKAHDDLQRHCDNQRKRIAELEGLYAGAKTEVAELKEQTRWMAQTDSRWEAAVRDLEQTKAENAKLRELVRKLHDELVSCEENEYIPGGHKFDKDVRELGVEV